MRVYVCRAKDGPLFVASDELAEVLDHAATCRMVGMNGAWKVRLGTTQMGLDEAYLDDWRIIAFREGGYARMVRRGTFWGLAREMPAEIEDVLCLALGIVPQRTWTPEEILAREG